MDSRTTIEGDGEERGNVIRLRDWLGPREELVPIGPRADAAKAADDDPVEAQPPTAASFWDEDSGSLQAPMQAPAEAWSGKWEPATDQRSVRPSASSPLRRRAIPRPRIRWSLGDPFVPRFARRRRAGTAIGGLAVCVLLALAVIGQTEGGPRTARKTAASLAGTSPIVTPTGVNRARLTPHTSVVTQIKRHHTSRAGAHHRAARQQHIRVATIRHRVRTHAAAQPTHTISAPTQSTTPTATTRTLAPVSAPPRTTTTPTPTTSAPTSPPVSTGSPTASTRQHQPAFGPSGSLGPGSSPDS